MWCKSYLKNTYYTCFENVNTKHCDTIKYFVKKRSKSSVKKLCNILQRFTKSNTVLRLIP